MLGRERGDVFLFQRVFESLGVSVLTSAKLKMRIAPIGT